MFDLAEQYHELIATLAADSVGCPHTTSELIGNHPQHPIAHGMPQRIIDLLETIKVQKQQGHLLFMTLGKADGLFRAFIKEGPIGQAGQGNHGERDRPFSGSWSESG